MKIRTDFVTNSSSSSFIFDGTLDLHELKKKAKIIPDEFWDESYLIDTLQYVIDNKIVPLKKFCTIENLCDIMEILDWYDEVWHYTDNYFEAVSVGTEEEKAAQARRRRKFMAAVLLRHFSDSYQDFYAEIVKDFPQNAYDAKQKKVISIMQQMTPKQVAEMLLADEETYCWFLAQSGALGSDNPLEELEEYAKELGASENWIYTCFRELMPGAEYVYFDGEELHYLVAEAIDRATDSVIVYCCHMG